MLSMVYVKLKTEVRVNRPQSGRLRAFLNHLPIGCDIGGKVEQPGGLRDADAVGFGTGGGHGQGYGRGWTPAEGTGMKRRQARRRIAHTTGARTFCCLIVF